MTKPFKLEGDTLEVNVDAGAGEIRAEVLNAEGKPITGFFGKDARNYHAVDDLRLQPRWKDDRDLSSLAGQVVRLRFHLAQARLYAFQIK